MLNATSAAGDYLAPYLRNVDVQWDRVSVNDLPLMNFPPSQRERYRLRPGDLLVCEGGEVGRTAIWRGELEECFYQKAVHRLRPLTSDECPRFFYYTMVSACARGVFVSEGNKSTISHLTAEKLRQRRFPTPPPPEQRAIASFLDRKTAAIDALIHKKERLIDLLQERRQALIRQAVTKGLDPSVPMKESGVEWLGKIPAHWEVRRLKFCCRLETGHTPSRSQPDYWVEEECVIPWVSLNDTKTLAANDFICDTYFRISMLGMANSAAHLIPAGAVVFTRDATIGCAAIIKRPMAVSQHVIAWVCNEDALYNRYLLRVIEAMLPCLESLTFGATIKTIGMDDVKGLVTPVPPLSEQRDIALHCRRAFDRLDEARRRIYRQLTLLRDYRQALITEAVTGKLDLVEMTA